MTDPIRDAFDLVAEQYAVDFVDELSRKPWDTERLRAFGQATAPGRVLDVGCGAAGHVGRFVADLGPRVVGVDFSERSVALARRLNPSLAFVVGDARALPVATGACAGIVAFYCLIYGGGPETSAALAELRRALTTGGLLLVAVHGGNGTQRFTDYKGTPIDVELHFRDPRPFGALVERAGFAIERIEVRPPYPFEHPTERIYVTARVA